MFMQRHMNFFLRIFVVFAVCLFFVSYFFLSLPQAAQAQSTCYNAFGDPYPCGGVAGDGTQDEIDAFGGTGNTGIGDTSGGSDGTSDPSTPGQDTGTGLTSADVPDAVAAAAEHASQQTNAVNADETESKIYNISVAMGGWVIALGGSIFDLAVQKVVLEMGCWFVKDGGQGCAESAGNGSLGAVVNALWTVVRDLFNILFIFSLVWIGLKTILSADDTGTQRALGWLIVAALLINFSLYFTKVIVDVANYTAVAIHSVATQGIKGTYGFEVGEVTLDGDDAVNSQGAGGGYTADGKSIASAYMETLRISSWFSGNPLKEVGQVVLFSIMVLLFSIILGMTLAFGGLMLVSRFIALIIFMIFSPAMFLGWVLPSFKQYSDMWWKKFIGYAFFAPAYIFMLYIGLYTMIQLKGTMGTGKYASSIGETWTKDTFTIFLFFAIGVGFLIAATKVGQSMSVQGANVAMNTTQGALRRMRNGATWVPRYGASWGASAAVGKAANWQGKRMDARDDARGKPRSRARRAMRSFVGKGESASFGVAGSRKERVDADKAESKKHTATVARRKIQSDMSSSDEATRQQAFQNATSEQLMQIAKTKDGRKAIMNNAHLLTPAKLEAIVKSDDVGETETGEIQKAHKKETVKYIKGDAAKPGKGFAKASTDELNAVGFEELQKEENIIHLSTDKIDKLKMVEAHKDTLKQEHEKAVLKVVRGGVVDGVTRANILKRKAGDIAKLPKGAFKEKDFVEALPESVIKSKAFAELDVSAQKDIRTHLENYVNNLPANASSRETERGVEIINWLKSPGGKSFGK